METITMICVDTKEKIEQVAKLAHEIWHEHFTAIIGTEQVDYMLEKFLSPKALEQQLKDGYEYFLISYQNQLVGFSGIREENNSIFLSKLYLRKECRGKGMSSYVMKKYVERCEEKHLDKIWLTCNRFNKNTLDIYEHFGFQKVRTQAADIGNGFVMDDYILEYKIDK